MVIMKIFNKKSFNCIAVFLIVLFCIFSSACQNPIMEKWWPESESEAESETEEPAEPGGKGDNFGVVRFDLGFEPNILLGEGPQPRDLTIAWDSIIGRLRPVNRNGFGFLGWFDENNIEWNVETRPVTEADDTDSDGYITLTAVWSVDKYIVSFVTEPSDAEIFPQLVAAGGRVIQPVNPPQLPDSRGFAGWFADPEYTAAWNFNTPVNDNITLYANWVLDIRNVKFETDGGRRPDGSLLTRTEIVVPYNGFVQDPGPVIKTGYSFDGWYTEDTYQYKWNFSNYPVQNDMILYAKFVQNIYIVSFIIAPSALVAPHPQTIAHGDPVNRPDDPAKLDDGRVFAGWYTVNGETHEEGWHLKYLWNFDTPVTSNRILYAKFVQNVYNVSFIIVPSALAAPPSQTIAHGNTIVRPNDPAKLDDGRIFAGWYTVDGETHEEGWHLKYLWNFNTPVTDNRILYARWLSQTEPVEPVIPVEPPVEPGGKGENFGVVRFNLDFEPNILLGEGPQPRDLNIAWGSTIGRLRPVNRNGYGFLGWFCEKNTEWDVETRPVTEEDDVDDDGFITLTAVWRVSRYVINFVTIPSDTVISPQVVAAGGKIIQPVNPPQLEDTSGFAGWYTDPDYTEEWDFSAPVNSNRTLYAGWALHTHNVRFETNGGRRPDGSEMSRTEFAVPHDGLVQDPGPVVRTGYSFDGWYTEDTYQYKWNFSNINYRVNEDMVLYAKWVINIYIVNFVITPSAASAPANQSIIHGNFISQPGNPQSGDGRVFAGWYTVNGSMHAEGWHLKYLWDFNTPVTENMTLFARYAPVTRTVVFKVNGGNDMPRTNFTIPIGNSILYPGAPSRPGYSFRGWFFDPACTPGSEINFSAYRIEEPDEIIGIDPLYLYAGWSMNPYRITFNSDDADDVAEPQYVYHGEMIHMPVITAPPRPGYYLNGWYTDTTYADERRWDFNGIVTSNRTLYARWESSDYVVNFFLGNPSGGSPHQVYIDALLEIQHHNFQDKVIEPFMPPLPAGDTSNWSFLRWDYHPDRNANPVNVNNPAFRSVLEPWDFDTGLDDNNTSDPTGEGAKILNLYARWVPPEPDMVWVPRGSFIMGDSGVAGSPVAYHSYPVRRVTLDGFYISRYPVTQINSPDTNRGYHYLMNVNPSQFNRNTFRPVERVSWYDAIEYCIELTRVNAGLDQVYTMTGISRPSAALPGTPPYTIYPINDAAVTWNSGNPNGYRLPTEAEWEYAARGGNGTPGNYIYSGSNNASDVAWYNETVRAEPSGYQATQTVGSKAPNALGIYDMSGNVSEWVWDRFISYKDYIASNPADLHDNPRGPSSGAERVRRGGGWSNAAGNVRSVVRNSDNPGSANWVIGFRIVRGPMEIY